MPKACFVLIAAAILPACVLGDLVSAGKECDKAHPCPSGYECVASDEAGVRVCCEKGDECGPSFPPLIAYWPFEEDTGSTSADATGHGYDADLFGGPAWEEGRIGRALHFDRVDDYFVVAGNPLKDVSDFSIAMWLRSDTGADYDALLTNQTTCVQYESVSLSTGSFGINSSNGDATRQGLNFGDQGLVVQDVWVHLVAAFTGDALRVFADGALRAERANVIGPPYASTHDLWGAAQQDGQVGGCAGNPPINWPFGGLIDDVRIYDGALSEAAIAALFDR
jgi:hypothetical protein